MENLYNDNAVRHGFFKINPILIIVLMAIFIPVSVLTSICYFQTKMNNNLPTFFSSIVVTSDAKIEEKNISVGDKILIKKQVKELSEQIVQIDINNKVLVAYFDAVEEETDNGSPVRIGYLQYFGKDADDQWVYGFVGNEKLIIGDAIIGVYQTNSSGKIGLTSFASSNLGLVLFSLLPLGTIFILLILDIFEQKRLKVTNQEIQWTLHPETKTQKKENKDMGKEKVAKDAPKQSEPQKPAQPEKPVEPQKPVQPEKTVEAQKSVQPEKPVEAQKQPAKPVQPEKPVKAQTGEQTAKTATLTAQQKSNAAQPDTNKNIAQQAPAKPVPTKAPAQQGKPIPQKPAVANAPAKPAQDAKVQKTTGQPEKPVAPAKPNAVPQKPSAPQKPTTPAKPSAPQKPTAPAKPSTPPKPNAAPQRPANLPPKK